MELFIPSLIVLILGALFAFFIIPRLSPYVLGGLAVAMFCLGLWQHYVMFPYEYRESMATDLLKQYSGFIMLLAVIFAGTLGILYMHGVSPPNAGDILPELPAMPNMPNMPNMPDIMGFKNNSGNIFNIGANANKPANAGIFGAANKPANNTKKNNNLASASFKTV